MTLKDDILITIQQNPGIIDSEIVLLHPGGPTRHQQVNQRCRSLAEEGLIIREKQAGKPISNRPIENPAYLNSFPEQLSNKLQHPHNEMRVAPDPRGGIKRPPVGADRALPGGAAGREILAGNDSNRRSLKNAVPATEISVSIRWHSAGEVLLDDDGKLKFPPLKSNPGVYRFRFTAKKALYIGESGKLRQRMGNYRTGNKSQSTSAWVHSVLHKAMGDSEVVLLDVCTDISLTRNGQRIPVDLTSKSVRLFAENAALINEFANGWELLNKVT